MRVILVGLLLVLPLVAAPGGAVAAGDAAAMRLYSQDAERGSLVATGQRGEYLLTLRGVKPRALWFDDLPGNRQGAISNGRLLGRLFGGANGRVNAAVDAWDPRRRDDVVMGVELLGGRWDAERRVLRYRVLDLAAADPDSSARVGATLPRRFSEAGVFIDGVAEEEIGKVFVEDAAGGSFRPAGKGGLHWLTLRGVKARALWFQDRPGDLAGTIDQRKLLDLFPERALEDRPNAAIDVWDPRQRDDVTVGVKVIDGRWNAKRHLLRYLVRPLRAQGGQAPLTLPRRFGRAGLYLDDCNQTCAELLAKGLEYAYNYLDNFFNGRHTCTGVISNLTPKDLTLIGQIKNDHNSWDREPDRLIPYNPHEFVKPSVFSSVGDWLRGCYAYAEYEIGPPSGGKRFILGIGLVDPYNDPNEFGCGATAPYWCYLEPSNLGGDHLIAYYCILSPTYPDPREYCPHTPE